LSCDHRRLFIHDPSKVLRIKACVLLNVEMLWLVGTMLGSNRWITIALSVN
jgi:hypothetical protein